MLAAYCIITKERYCTTDRYLSGRTAVAFYQIEHAHGDRFGDDVVKVTKDVGTTEQT
jgi:hypothetical protein